MGKSNKKRQPHRTATDQRVQIAPITFMGPFILNFKSVHRTIQCIFSRIIMCVLPSLVQNYTGTDTTQKHDGWRCWPRRSELEWDWFQRLNASEQAHCGRNSHFLMSKLLFLEGSTRFKHFVVFFGRSFYEEHCHKHFQKR